MVQRTKRGIGAGEAEGMKRELSAFHRQVLQWSAKAPVGEPLYVSLETLNHALILTDRELQGAIDNERKAWPPGWQGL
ncbi:MAG: hypothetical protein K0S00_3973 [Xanthobacteraceae bacterium]|jgi:hypothetical protein|nr:hypothetical protein [Xanthobacteraceae bacterium]